MQNITVGISCYITTLFYITTAATPTTATTTTLYSSCQLLWSGYLTLFYEILSTDVIVSTINYMSSSSNLNSCRTWCWTLKTRRTWRQKTECCYSHCKYIYCWIRPTRVVQQMGDIIMIILFKCGNVSRHVYQKYKITLCSITICSKIVFA